MSSCLADFERGIGRPSWNGVFGGGVRAEIRHGFEAMAAGGYLKCSKTERDFFVISPCMIEGLASLLGDLLSGIVQRCSKLV